MDKSEIKSEIERIGNMSHEERFAAISSVTEEEFEQLIAGYEAAGTDPLTVAMVRAGYEGVQRGQADPDRGPSEHADALEAWWRQRDAAMQRTGAKTVDELILMMRAIGAKSFDELPAVPKED